MFKSKNVLVTGGSGMIGRQLVKHLLLNIILYYFPFIIDLTLLTIASGVGGKLSTSG